MKAKNLLAGVELGGTKCVCILGTGPHDIRAHERLATRDPASTLAHIESVLADWSSRYGAFDALGLASFGPLNLDPKSATYGDIAETTKPGWSGAPLAGRFSRRFSVPVGVNTDVNGAALAEGRWGAAQGLANHAYITVGTGVGVGLVVNGQTVYGCNHPEMGHVRPVRQPGDTWPGICVFHGDCVEGLASGPAIEARAGAGPDTLADDDPAWFPVVHSLAQLLHTLVLTTAPDRIVIGGGVMSARASLYVRLRSELQKSLNGYVAAEEVVGGLSEYVVPPALGTLAGPLGALVLAEQALAAQRR
jgi:fructokinase